MLPLPRSVALLGRIALFCTRRAVKMFPRKVPSFERLLAYYLVMALLYAKRMDFLEYVRSRSSLLCEWLSERPTIESDLSRDAFAATSVEPVSNVPGHTHASAASLRTAGTTFATNMAAYCGSELYVLGMSKSDQRKDMKGSRQWYWAKDVNADNRVDSSSDSDVRYMCDVDYYVDMNALLTREVKPLLLYTVVPETAVSVGETDTTFCFDMEGQLVTLVAGGGTYSHHLWNYARDSILAVNRIIGIPCRAVSYAIERKQVGKHRQMVLLTPIRVFDGLGAIIATALLGQSQLERFNPVEEHGSERFVRFVIHRNNETSVTVARPSQFVCATVPVSVDHAVATVASLGSTKLMLPTTASWIKDDRAAAAVLTDYHRVATRTLAPVVYPVSSSVRAYQFSPETYDCEARAKLEAFMSPLVHAAFAPVPNEAGERRCVDGRIKGLRKDEPKPNRFRDQCMREFADLVMQGATLEPVCFEVVEQKQTSPAQKLSLLKAVLTGNYRSLVLKCFIKAEAYLGAKDPRNISTYNDADKLDMAQFALALSEHCKQFAWYGPGKTPLEIAGRVAEICSEADYVNISDYHRMDGTITYTLRQVDRLVCMKAFANHRVKLNELLKTNVDNKGYLPYGTSFEQGPSHGSGCSATSLFQTLRASFTTYYAFRTTRNKNGDYFTPTEAFNAIGIHLGDDGLDADLPTSRHENAARNVGLVLEAGVVQRGERGVTFLARYYSPEVWEGSLNSMCDIRRQLSKFHTTVRLPENVQPEQKLVEKAMSYVATDGNTPVVGEFCKRVLLLSQYRPRTLLGVGNWWSKFDGSVQYPNENVGGWMDVDFGIQFPEFDRHLFKKWLDGVTEPPELLSPPLCIETQPPAPGAVSFVVDEDVVPAQDDRPSRKTEKSVVKRKRRKRTGPAEGSPGQYNDKSTRRSRFPKGARS